MAMITIGSTALPNPTTYKVKRSDLDSEATTRNSEGQLIRDRVREGVYRIDVSWGTLTKADYMAVVTALSPARFSVAFFDPNSATTKTAYMYASDRDSELVQYTDESYPENSIWSLSCSLIEY